MSSWPQPQPGHPVRQEILSSRLPNCIWSQLLPTAALRLRLPSLTCSSPPPPAHFILVILQSVPGHGQVMSLCCPEERPGSHLAQGSQDAPFCPFSSGVPGKFHLRPFACAVCNTCSVPCPGVQADPPPTTCRFGSQVFLFYLTAPPRPPRTSERSPLLHFSPWGSLWSGKVGL